jgi:hypothetical protein
MVSINRNYVATREGRIWKSFPSSSGSTKIWCVVCLLVLMVSLNQLNQLTIVQGSILTMETSTSPSSAPELSDVSTSPQTLSPIHRGSIVTKETTNSRVVPKLSEVTTSVETTTSRSVPELSDISTSPQTFSPISLPTNVSSSDYLQGFEYCPFELFPTTGSGSLSPKWSKHYQELARTNKQQAAAARKYSENSPPPVAKPRIPHRLIFTHRYNVFDCELKCRHYLTCLQQMPEKR